MSAHTPGPWLLDGRLVYALRDSGRGLENVFSAAVTGGFGTSSGETVANARLIAAAPDLLAALNTILPWADAWHRIGEERHVPLPLLWRGIDEARAAIAKATGGGK